MREVNSVKYSVFVFTEKQLIRYHHICTKPHATKLLKINHSSRSEENSRKLGNSPSTTLTRLTCETTTIHKLKARCKSFLPALSNVNSGSGFPCRAGCVCLRVCLFGLWSSDQSVKTQDRNAAPLSAPLASAQHWLPAFLTEVTCAERVNEWEERDRQTEREREGGEEELAKRAAVPCRLKGLLLLSILCPLLSLLSLSDHCPRYIFTFAEAPRLTNLTFYITSQT